MDPIDRPGLAEDRRRSRRTVGLLILTALTVITVDAGTAGSAPISAAREAVGTVLGPVETAASTVFRPIEAVPRYFGDVRDLRAENDALAERNAALSSELAATQASQHRVDAAHRLATFGDTSGFELVTAQVVAMGPAQSFSRAVTIDAGTDDGVVPDLTVVNADGLVGRVIEATRSTATVLLIIDAKSTVGGRLGDSMELGFLDGDSDIAGDATLELSLVDHTVSPRVGDTVVTWGSHDGAPYVPGVPIGTVVGVHSSPAELTETAEVRPNVDFSSLDVVAVVVDTEGDSDVASGGVR